MRSYSDVMHYFNYYYPYVIPSQNCIPRDWMMNVILPVLDAAEDTKDPDAFPELSWELQNYDSLLDYLNQSVSTAAEYQVNPNPLEWVWRYTHVTPLNNLRVVVIGQDPYCTGIRSDGLAFSSADPDEVGESLQIIFKAIEEQTNYVPEWNGNLTRWAKRGVLLLDAISTAGAKPKSHEDFGWLEMNNMLLYTLSDYYEHILDRHLFAMAWGYYAKKITHKVLFDDQIQHDLQSYLFNRFYPEYDCQTATRTSALSEDFHEVVSSVHPSPRNNFGVDFITNDHFSDFQAYIEGDGFNNVPWT